MPLQGFNIQRDPRRHGGHTRKGRPFKGLTHNEIHKDLPIFSWKRNMLFFNSDFISDSVLVIFYALIISIKPMFENDVILLSFSTRFHCHVT